MGTTNNSTIKTWSEFPAMREQPCYYLLLANQTQ
jgi:hypothetical protein